MAEYLFQRQSAWFCSAAQYEDTAFRKTVWEILLTIPFGRTMTYGEIADRIAKRNGVTAYFQNTL